MKENLYHFTSITTLKNILENGILFKKNDLYSENFKYYYTISTTRKFNFNFIHDTNVRIVLDKDKIKNDYKIIPTHWYNTEFKNDNVKPNGADDQRTVAFVGRDSLIYNQFEERICMNPNDVYKRYFLLPKYIKQIDVLESYKDKMEQFKNPYNIKIQYYRTFKDFKPIKEMKHIKTYQQIFENREDRNGNHIGDGKYHANYNIFEFPEYPNIQYDISKSDTTESVYITYRNTDNNKKITVRFSGHENNAIKFGDQLNGLVTTKNEILYHLGLKKRTFIPLKQKSIFNRKVSNKDILNNIYKESDKTISDLYDMNVGTDLSEYKNKLAKNSNYLILGDKVEEIEITSKDFLGRTIRKGNYVYENKHIKTYKQIFENNNYDEFILPKGSILYHGTVENIRGELGVGGYDKVLWTAKDKIISKMYIPDASTVIYTSTRIISKADMGDSARNNFLKDIGLIYYDVKFQNNRPTSYGLKYVGDASYLNDISKQYDTNWNIYHKLDVEYRKLLDEYKKLGDDDNISDDELEMKYKKMSEVEAEKEKISEQIPNVENEILKYINKKLEELGYKGDSNSIDKHWKLKEANNKIQRADYRSEGSLYQLTAKQDIKFYDMTKDSEGDLTDLQYHKVDLFRKAEENGYNGVKIHDFAQSDVYGNYGHLSYGIFKDSIALFDVKFIEKAYHPNENELK